MLMNKKIRKNAGITLIALVITIVVLLILAGVAISMLSGDKGILNNTKIAVKNSSESTAMEQVSMAWTACEMNYRTAHDEKSNSSKSAFFTIDKLNEYIGSNGLITNLIYDEENPSKVTYKDNKKNIYVFMIDNQGNIKLTCNHKYKNDICTLCGIFNPEHIHTNEAVVGKQVCFCGYIKYIDVKSNSGGIIYDSEAKKIKIPATYQSGDGYYRIVELAAGQFWNRNYAGYDLYLPNTITTIGKRWLCDWGVTANVYYDGTQEEWNKISKNSEWYSLMSVRLFFKDKIICNSHSYGDYIVTMEPTNTEDGSRYRECQYCGYKEESTIQKYNQTSKFSGATQIDSTNKTITIMPTVEKDGVTYNIVELSKQQFWSRNYSGYTIYLPNTITSIGYRWICDWGVTANIYYDGTQEEWNKISKHSEWCQFMSVNLHCTDETLN